MSKKVSVTTVVPEIHQDTAQILKQEIRASNWISEFSILKNALPKNWIDILKKESSVKSIVNIKKDYFIWNDQFINLSTLSNKLLYNILVNVKFSKPIGTHYWIKYLVLSEKPNTSSLYFFHFQISNFKFQFSNFKKKRKQT